MTTPEILIYHHPDPQSSLLPLLRAHLPHSVPLLRRIQHGLAYPSPTAAVLATFPATTTLPSTTEPWLAAHVDLFRGRETQIYIYSSLEREASSPPASAAGVDSDFVSTFGDRISMDKQARTRDQLLAFLAYVKANLLPEYLSSPKAAAAAADNPPSPSPSTPGTGSGTGTPVKKIPPPPPTAFLIGSMHTGLATLLTASGTDYSDRQTLPGVRIIRRDDPPYVKYLFRPEAYRLPSTGTDNDNTTSDKDKDRDEAPERRRHPLPPGYRFHDRRGRYGVQPHHHALVSSRTHIPRSSETLARMPGVAVYYDGDDKPNPNSSQTHDGLEGEEEMPIAWAFLGVDGSLATLHVEPAHRGRGIGACVSREAMRSGFRAGGIFRSRSRSRSLGEEEGEGEGEGELGHTDVLVTNRASRRVMEKLGGEIGWTDTWVVVELEG